MSFVRFIIKLLLFIPKPIIAEKAHLRILGGRNATAGEFPFIVIILRIAVNADNKNVYERLCSGALITERWTITAAHCDYGSTNMAIQYDKKTARVTSFNTHPKYPSLSYDIALLNHLAIQLPEYGRLSAIEYSALYGQEAICAGYGAYQRTPKNKANVLDKSQLQYDYKLSPGLQVLNCLVVECPPVLGMNPRICVTVSCNERSIVRSIGPGDSGSPLVHASGIVGIAAAVTEGETQGYAGYYVPISYFLGWIRNTMKKESERTVRKRAKGH